MRKPRGSLSSGLVMSLVAAGTTWIAMLSWGGFTDNDPEYLGPLLFLGVTVALTGAVARWWRLPGAVVVLAQLVVSALMLSLLLTGSPLPIQGAWTELVNGFRDAIDSAQNYAAPVPMQVPGIDPLLISGGLASMLILDALACTARKVPLAGLPLLTIYSVPISLLDGGVSLWVFVPTAVGFMTLLFLHENDLINRWGRPIGSRPGRGRLARLVRGAHRCGPVQRGCHRLDGHRPRDRRAAADPDPRPPCLRLRCRPRRRLEREDRESHRRPAA